MPQNNGKQNTDEYYTNKYQIHTTGSYGYKLVYVDDKFSKPFNTNLGEDRVCNFINFINIIIWSKKVSIVRKRWKNILTSNLWLRKKTMKILRTLL